MRVRTALLRVGGAVLTVLLASVVAFVILRLLPGDPARLILGPLAGAKAVAAERVALGLNEPIYIQYAKYIVSFVTGHWGFDYSSGVPILGEVLTRLPASLELGFYALLLASIGAVVTAVASVYFDWKGPDYLFRAGAYFSLGSPPFWVGLMALIVFVEYLGVLPGPTGRLSTGITPPPPITHFYTFDAILGGQWSTLGDALAHLLLPAATLGLASYGFLYRLLRNSLMQVVDEEFMTVCRSKGLTRWQAILRHALPNSLLPAVTAGGLLVAQLVAGSVLVETIFNWPGVGQLVVQSILVREYGVVEAFVLLSAIAFVVVNLAVDALYVVIDPRLRRSA
jgi:ABC-type dipeptide/oligopeptide/nickel transport system permease component